MNTHLIKALTINNPLSQKLSQHQRFKIFSTQQHHQQPRNHNTSQILTIHKANILKTVKLYTWRSKTYLPIFKPISLEITSESSPNHLNLNFNFQNIQNTKVSLPLHENQLLKELDDFIDASAHITYYLLKVKMEDVKFTLQNLNNFVQPQILHLFKEILIGYELLVNIFGFFVVTDKMIVLNNNNQWKVWINQNLNKNQVGARSCSRKQFFINLTNLIQNHTLSTQTSRKFFELIRAQIQQRPSFIKIILKINKFIIDTKIQQANRVMISTMNTLINSKKYKQNSRIDRGNKFSNFTCFTISTFLRNQRYPKIKLTQSKHSFQYSQLSHPQIQNTKYFNSSNAIIQKKSPALCISTDIQKTYRLKRELIKKQSSLKRDTLPLKLTKTVYFFNPTLKVQGNQSVSKSQYNKQIKLDQKLSFNRTSSVPSFIKLKRLKTQGKQSSDNLSLFYSLRNITKIGTHLHNYSQIMIQNGWKSVIPPLFDPNSSTKDLNQTVKLQNDSSQPNKKGYLKDIRLEMLENLRKKARKIALDRKQKQILQAPNQDQRYTKKILNQKNEQSKSSPEPDHKQKRQIEIHKKHGSYPQIANQNLNDEQIVQYSHLDLSVSNGSNIVIHDQMDDQFFSSQTQRYLLNHQQQY